MSKTTAEWCDQKRRNYSSWRDLGVVELTWREVRNLLDDADELRRVEVAAKALKLDESRERIAELEEERAAMIVNHDEQLTHAMKRVQELENDA